MKIRSENAKEAEIKARSMYEEYRVTYHGRKNKLNFSSGGGGGGDEVIELICRPLFISILL
jgi:hypothetical protein